MSSVFPGREEVLANSLRLVSMLRREDLPTLERPMKATSESSVSGQPASSGAEMRKVVWEIFMAVS